MKIFFEITTDNTYVEMAAISKEVAENRKWTTDELPFSDDSCSFYLSDELTLGELLSNDEHAMGGPVWADELEIVIFDENYDEVDKFTINQISACRKLDITEEFDFLSRFGTEENELGTVSDEDLYTLMHFSWYGGPTTAEFETDSPYKRENFSFKYVNCFGQVSLLCDVKYSEEYLSMDDGDDWKEHFYVID